MNRDDIIRLAYKSGFETGMLHDPTGTPSFPHIRARHANSLIVELEKFAELVAAAEREECAKLCETGYKVESSDQTTYTLACPEMAARIRSRGTEAA